jgi:hypothetical protein
MQHCPTTNIFRTKQLPTQTWQAWKIPLQYDAETKMTQAKKDQQSRPQGNYTPGFSAITEQRPGLSMAYRSSFMAIETPVIYSTECGTKIRPSKYPYNSHDQLIHVETVVLGKKSMLYHVWCRELDMSKIVCFESKPGLVNTGVLNSLWEREILHVGNSLGYRSVLSYTVQKAASAWHLIQLMGSWSAQEKSG